jgi:hypothetical protein
MTENQYDTLRKEHGLILKNIAGLNERLDQVLGIVFHDLKEETKTRLLWISRLEELEMISPEIAAHLRAALSRWDSPTYKRNTEKSTA